MSDSNILDKSMRSVFVGNIPYEATEERLKDIFNEVGPVLSFKLVYDRETGKPKGYGFCEYKDQETALSAMRNLNGYEIGGRSLRVDNACTEKSRLEMQSLLAGPPVDNTYGDPVDADKAPEEISKAVASLPPEQMFELMKQMKLCIQNNPAEGKQMLLQNPQLAYALLQAQVVMRIVDPQVAVTMLHKANPTVTPMQVGSDNSRSTPAPVPAPTSAPPRPVEPPVPPPPPRVSAHPPTPNPHAPQFIGQDMDMRALDPRAAALDPRATAIDPRASAIDPRVASIDPRSSSLEPRGTAMDPRSAAIDPRSAVMASAIDPRNAVIDSRSTNMDPRAAVIDPRATVRDQDLRIPSMAPPPPNMLPAFQTEHQTNQTRDPRDRYQRDPRSVASRAAPAPVAPPSRPPAPGFTATIPSGATDQEKAALIMQVLQLSDDQIAMLPPEQRQSILVLKEQIAKSTQR